MAAVHVSLSALLLGGADTVESLSGGKFEQGGRAFDQNLLCGRSWNECAFVLSSRRARLDYTPRGIMNGALSSTIPVLSLNSTY
jgi:hypothetical protein